MGNGTDCPGLGYVLTGGELENAAGTWSLHVGNYDNAAVRGVGALERSTPGAHRRSR